MMQFHSKFSFLLLLCLMHICIEAKGTEHEDEPLVTLDMRQAPVQKVLTEITRQTGSLQHRRGITDTAYLVSFPLTKKLKSAAPRLPFCFLDA